ncbi:MAG: hypothetical protein A2W93_09460 [Bacteroidetes bacterium GWF2_43_63]|nr:MAG: hypothetical protein A2W94_05845 [Bacteroidetes bacterium GWE2_42_42]OFY54542.1 MAG: hypothetical protein A2W93_09460 [Bacteroidetes bacterium GWF2_43_63]HBG70473.1 DNA polymerase III subunit epsilon [Bacteroidales bacterium]HCB63409.1 DNA polymerase III subunit epsilon [Bacteroidales bacterium]
MLRLSRPLVFFDTETTGTDTVNDRILEISAIKIHPYGEKETITQRINPTRPIPKEASNVHGIYDSDVENMPTFYEYKNTVIDFFKDCDVAGFNILSYDVPILVEEILRAEGDEPFDEKTKFIDALKIYHENEKRDLSSAYKFYCDKNLEGAHGAEADTNATIEVLEKQIVKYGLPNTVEELHEISNKGNAIVDYGRKFVRNQKGNIVFSFGKHKDESVHRHFDYLKWMLGADFSKHTKYIIRQILNGNFGKEQSEYPKDLFL